MAYLGRGLDKISNIEVLDNITFDGSSSYSITKGSVAFTPNSAQSCLISIDGVVQATNFTVNSSTIDFGVAVPSTSTCNFFLHYGTGVMTVPSDGSVTTAKLGDSAVTTAKLGDDAVTGAKISKPFNYDSGTFYLDDTNNRVGIGTTSPNAELEIKADTPEIRIDSTASSGRNYKIHSDGDELYLEGIGSSGSLKIGESGTYGVNIDLGSGSVGIGKSPDGSVATTGVEFATEGYGLLARSGNTVLYVNRKTNDGTVISIRQDTVEEGTISVSGGTVSYNGFTGTHWSRFQDNSTPTILKGTVLESLDEMCDWYNLQFDVTDEEGNTYTQDVPHVLLDTQSEGDIITYNHEGTDYQATITKEADIKHMKSKVSDTVDAKNVYGVFSSYDNNYEEGYNDFYVASVGSFVVRIKANETIAKGDLLQSNGDGTAKVQTDDNVKSSSFAKVLSTTIIETYEDGSFIVPCSLMC